MIQNLLNMNNDNMKVDVIMMNPPYLGTNLGDNLYVDFLNKCLEKGSNTTSFSIV